MGPWAILQGSSHHPFSESPGPGSGRRCIKATTTESQYLQRLCQRFTSALPVVRVQAESHQRAFAATHVVDFLHSPCSATLLVTQHPSQRCASGPGPSWHCAAQNMGNIRLRTGMYRVCMYGVHIYRRNKTCRGRSMDPIMK